MKIKSTAFLVVCSISLMSFWSCSEDDSEIDEDNGTACADFETEYSEVMNALSDYSENPSVANCENYKEALMAFYEDFRDCPLWGDEYQQAIDEIEEMDCSNQGT